MNQLFLYTQPFDHHLQSSDSSLSPFWQYFYQISSKDLGSMLVLVPSKQIESHLRERLSRQHPQIAEQIEIQTLDMLLTESVSDYRFSTSHQKLFLKQFLNLWSFSSNFSSELLVGYLDQLLFLIQECERYGYQARTFDESTDGFSSIIPDLGSFVTDFLKAKQQYAVTDVFHCYQLAAKTYFSEVKKKINQKHLVFVGFWFLPAYQKPFVDMLLKNVKTSSFLLYFVQDYMPFQSGRLLYEWLLNRSIMVREISVVDDSLTRFNQPRVVEASTIEDEVDYVAQTIMRLMADTSVAKDISIVVPQLTLYQQIIQDVFIKYKIPYQFSYGRALQDSFIYTFVLQLFQVLKNDFLSKDVFLFFNIPFTASLHINDALINVDVQFLKDISIEKRVKENGSNWILALQSKRNEINRQLQKGKFNLNKIYLLKTQLEKVDAHLVLFDIFQQFRTHFFNANNASDFIQILHQFISLFKIEDQLDDLSRVLSEDFEIKRLERFNQSLAVFSDACTDFSENTRFQGYIDFNQAAEDFLLFIKDTLVKESDIQNNCVSIFGKFDSFMVSKSTVFILGCIEGLWPGQVKNNVFIEDKDRRKLRWPTQSTYYHWDFYLFFSLIHANQCIITYPGLKSDVASIRSHFLYLLEDIFQQKLCVTQFLPSSKLQVEPAVNVHDKRDSVIKGKATSIFQYDKTGLIWRKNQPDSFSVTALETYQKCPYHYFLRYIVKEPGLPPEGVDISSLIWGEFVHELLYLFYVSVKAEGSQSLSLLIAICESLFEKYAGDDPYWNLKKAQLFGDKQHKGMLEKYIEDMNVDVFSNALLLEKAFELEEGKSVFGRTLRRKIVGKIDAVFQLRDTMESVVVDYKTGAKLPTGSDLKNHYSLQLPLYYLALLAIKDHMKIVGGAYYQLYDHNRFGQQVMFVSGDSSVDFVPKYKRPFKITDVFLMQLVDHINVLIEKIEGALFGVNLEIVPQNKRLPLCHICNYRFICTYEHRFSRLGV